MKAAHAASNAALVVPRMTSVSLRLIGRFRNDCMISRLRPCQLHQSRTDLEADPLCDAEINVKTDFAAIHRKANHPALPRELVDLADREDAYSLEAGKDF